MSWLIWEKINNRDLGTWSGEPYKDTVSGWQQYRLPTVLSMDIEILKSGNLTTETY